MEAAAEGDTDMGQLAALVPILATAASAAGAGLEISSASNTANQENQAVANELAQQQQYTRQAQKPVAQNIQASAAKPAQATIDQGAASQLARYSQLQQQPVTNSASPTPQNRVTTASGNAQIDQMSQAAANLAGYSTWENAESINNQNVANQLGVINQESAAAGATLPAQLSQAQSSGQQTAGIGSLLSSAGGAAGTYAAQQPYANALSTYLNNANYNQTYGGGLPSGWQTAPSGEYAG
jgi:hypothetical protein